MYIQALKRRAEVESEVSDIVRLRINTRAKLRKMTDDSEKKYIAQKQQQTEGL
jgi:hypothetical protein